MPHPTTSDDGRPFTSAEQDLVNALDTLVEILTAIDSEVGAARTRRYQRPPREPIGPSPAYLELERLLAGAAADNAEARARAAEADLRAANARRAATDAQAAAEDAQTDARTALAHRVRTALPGAAA